MTQRFTVERFRPEHAVEIGSVVEGRLPEVKAEHWEIASQAPEAITVRDEGTIIACAGIAPIAVHDTGEAWALVSSVVSGDRRRAKAVYESLSAGISCCKLGWIVARAKIGMPTTKTFLEKLGFVDTGRTMAYLGEDYRLMLRRVR